MSNIRVPMRGVRVQRDGISVTAAVDTPFDFTSDELADIAAVEKSSGRKFLREVVDESGEVQRKIDADNAERKLANEKVLAGLKKKSDAAAEAFKKAPTSTKRKEAAEKANEEMLAFAEKTGLSLEDDGGL